MTKPRIVLMALLTCFQLALSAHQAQIMDQNSPFGYNNQAQYPIQTASYQIRDACNTVWYYVGHPYYCWFQSAIPPPPPPPTLRPLPTPRPTYHPAVTTTVKPPVPTPRCPFRIPGWARIKGQRYYLSKMGNSSWFQADARALSIGAYLAEIDSEMENRIFEVIKDCYPKGTHIWIGGNDLAKQGQWVWSNGNLIGPYTNWRPGNDGDCVELILPDSGWHKSDCFGKSMTGYAFIAEKKDSSTTPKPTSKPSPSLPTTTTSTTTTRRTTTTKPTTTTTRRTTTSKPTTTTTKRTTTTQLTTTTSRPTTTSTTTTTIRTTTTTQTTTTIAAEITTPGGPTPPPPV